MKNIFLVAILSLFSVNINGQSSTSKKKIEINQIIGKWNLVEYNFRVKPTKPKNLTSCDSILVWNFYIDSKTKKNMLSCLDSSNSCKDYNFESDWVLNGNNLMIRRTKIMGFGGISASGTFLIKEISNTKMVLEFQKNTYVFIKR